MASEVTDIREAMEAALKTVAPLLQTYVMQIQVEMDDHLPRVVGQPVALRQALLAVITAAISFGHGGRPDTQPRLSVKAGPKNVWVEMWSAAERRDAALSVSTEVNDNLALARKLLELSGGQLEVGSLQSGVLRVKITLSIATQVPVLVVDDNADTLRLMERYLTGSRYSFTGSSHPDQALTLAQELMPKVIVLDVMFPEVDGWEILGRLREHPRTQHIPVIISTILPQESLAMALGAAAFLRKPVSREVLLLALEQQSAQSEPAGPESG